jgi:hypothetical protein
MTRQIAVLDRSHGGREPLASQYDTVHLLVRPTTADHSPLTTRCESPMPYRLPRAPEGFRRSICGFGAGGSLHRHDCVFRMHRYLDSLPRGRRLGICWQRLQLRRIYLLALIGLRERVGPSSEGTRRPYRVAPVGYLSCKAKGTPFHFVRCDVVYSYVMFKEAIRRRERDDRIP